ncbi:hypothetical protein R6Q59_011895 [Mikania micrantha]|uniref:Cyclin-dependent kinase inhibitor n=1 Tax=Mikania micrantha TaxID=192012 RepID=A0A5N6LNP3_9ASTR|nr:hypothetical protein E3N88_40772 [Mikania micrantha]
MDSNRCKSIDDIAVISGSKSHGGVRRSRETEVTSSDSGKRRKLDTQDHENVVELENQCRSGVDVNSTEHVVSSTESGDNVLLSSCCNHDLSLDLKAELRSDTETETSMSGNGGFSRETSPSSEICLDSDEMESSSTLKNKPAPPPAANSRRKQSPATNTPTAAEINEFFSAIEKKEQKRFVEKYNYDIVNDVPMDGKYQWVRLKP